MTTETITDFLWVALFVGVALGVMLFVIYSLSSIAKNEKKIRKSLKCPCDYIGNVTVDLAENSVESSIKLTINTDFANLVDIISKQHELTFSANVIE